MMMHTRLDLCQRRMLLELGLSNLGTLVIGAGLAVRLEQLADIEAGRF